MTELDILLYITAFLISFAAPAFFGMILYIVSNKINSPKGRQYYIIKDDLNGNVLSIYTNEKMALAYAGDPHKGFVVVKVRELK